VKVPRRIIVTAVARLALVAACPSAVRDTFETVRVSVCSRQCLEEWPRRLTRPGRCRFCLQPLPAILRGGDAAAMFALGRACGVALCSLRTASGAPSGFVAVVAASGAESEGGNFVGVVF
jgi:hypothetical protein